MKIKRFWLLIILFILLEESYSFSNYDEPSKNIEITGFFKRLADGQKYTIVLDKTITLQSINVTDSENDIPFRTILQTKLSQIFSNAEVYIPASITFDYTTLPEVNITEPGFDYKNKIVIKGDSRLPTQLAQAMSVESSNKKYQTPNKGEIVVYYNNLKDMSQIDVAYILLHEILHIFSNGHSYYFESSGYDAYGNVEKNVLPENKVMYYKKNKTSFFTKDEEMGLKAAYYPLQFKHQLREGNQSDYTQHDTRLLFNRDLDDDKKKDKFIDYKLYLQGNEHTPNACFKILNQRDIGYDELFDIDEYYEADLNYYTGSVGMPNSPITTFIFDKAEKEMDVKFKLGGEYESKYEGQEVIDRDTGGNFRLRLYHEYNEDYLHVYPDKTTRNYYNKNKTLEENANDYIDFKVVDLKITEPAFNSTLDSDNITIKIFPFEEETGVQLKWAYIEENGEYKRYQGVKKIEYLVIATEKTESYFYNFTTEQIDEQFELNLQNGSVSDDGNSFELRKKATYTIIAYCFDEKNNPVGEAQTVFNISLKPLVADTNEPVLETPDWYFPINRKLKPDPKNLDNYKIEWNTGEILNTFNDITNINYEKFKGYLPTNYSLKMVKREIGFENRKIVVLKWPIDKDREYDELDFEKLINGPYDGKPMISKEVWNEVKTTYNSDKYYFEFVLDLQRSQDNKSDNIEFLISEFEFNLRRPISLSSAIMVFKKPKPDTGAKTVWGTIIPLLELDTLRVTVPKYDTEAEYWGGVEVLLDGELSPKITIPPVTAEDPQPEYSETDTTRTYKFVWDFSEQPEGFVTLHARYKNDPLSYSQKKVKVGYSETWEDFEDGMGNWTLGTQYAYPPGNGPEVHYWRTSFKDDIKSVELRSSTASFSAQRFEILSPVIEVPLAEDSVHTFLTFDYARELGSLVFGGGRSMMIVQVCDASGNALSDQFFGSLYPSDDNFPVAGYTLNLPNFFAPNSAGLFGDNVWNKYTFWLNWGDALGEDAYHSYSGRQIRLKLIQFYTTNFAGIIDNNTNFVYNPPEYTDLTYHRFDNFQVKTYYQINLPPTIDQVADQEVKQHCGWQEINLTGITNGENSIFGDDENLDDLEEQGKSSLLRSIKHIKNVEQREDGSLKITALVEEDKEFKEVVLPTSTKKGSKFLTQRVITVTLDSDNKSLIPLDSLKLKEPYMTGDSTAVLMYRPADKFNGTCNITVRVQDDGKAENGGRDYTKMKFKVNVLPFNPPEYDPPITELGNLIEDFEEITINLNSHFTDVDGDKIYYSASSSNPSLIEISLNEGILNIQSVKDAFGTCDLTIAADDSTGTVPTVIQVAVNIEDDNDDLFFSSGFSSQELQLPANFGTKRINIAEQFTNELPSTPVYSVTQTNPAVLDAVFEGSELCLTSKTDVTGQTDITVNVAVDTRVISSQIKAVAGNLPPEIITEIADIETPANFKTMYINLKDHYRDPNKDWLGYTVKSSQEKVDTYISFYDDQLIIESKANESGIDSLYISSYDGKRSSVTASSKTAIRRMWSE